MSLLLDALKRAEQEKLARQGQAAPLEEMAEAAPAPARRTLELESHESVSPAPPGKPATAAAGDRQAAKTVFAAKQSVPEPQGSSSKKAILAIAGAALIALLAGGGYVWFEINKVASPIARAPVAPSPVKAAPPATSPATDAKPADIASDTKAEPAKGDVPPVATLKPENVKAKAKPQPKAAEQLVMNLLKDSPRAAKAAPALKLDRTIDAPRVAPDVSKGYEALRAGDLATARKSYESAVAADPTGLDGHLGLATVAARQGDRTAATRHYRRALELDSKNPTAIAGLAALADFSRPDALEAQLRADLTRYPSSAALHYTLGNLYAAQSRWNEAQASYFEAYRLDADSADIAYNLAVSLDHLGQARLAADFYQRALAASRQQLVQFDKGQVTRRLAELKP